MDMRKFTDLVVAISAIGALMVSLYNASQIQQVHLTFNSRMSEFIDLVKKDSRAEGVKAGQDGEKPK